MKKDKRLYNMGGNAIEDFYPSNNSYKSMIDNKTTPANIQKQKERAIQEQLQIDAQNKKLESMYGSNAVKNRTNRKGVQ
jgi:hypothetical protein